MDEKANALNWFEIPVTDFPRAKKFYETIFAISLEEMQMGPLLMGMFPYGQNDGRVGGAICHGEWYKPSADGPIIYLNGNPDLQNVLNRIEAAGGKVIMPKTEISPEIGFMAMFMDCEGNRMALHSNK